MPPRRSQRARAAQDRGALPAPRVTRDCPPIPTEIAQMIANQLSLKTACALARTCKSLQETGEIRIWRHVECVTSRRDYAFGSEAEPLLQKYVTTFDSLQRISRRQSYVRSFTFAIMAKQRMALTKAQKRLAETLAPLVTRVDVRFVHSGGTRGDGKIRALRQVLASLSFPQATSVVLPAVIGTVTNRGSYIHYGGWQRSGAEGEHLRCLRERVHYSTTRASHISYNIVFDMISESFPSAQHVGLLTRDERFPHYSLTYHARDAPSEKIGVHGRHQSKREYRCDATTPFNVRREDLARLAEVRHRCQSLRSLRLLSERNHPFADPASAYTSDATFPETPLIAFHASNRHLWVGILIQHYLRPVEPDSDRSSHVTCVINHCPTQQFRAPGQRTYSYLVASQETDHRVMTASEYEKLNIGDILDLSGQHDLTNEQWARFDAWWDRAAKLG